MADLSPVTTWTAEDAAHLGRRAGFGISPEAAAALAAQSPGTAVAAWVDGTGLDTARFDDVWANRADPVTEPQRQASSSAGSVTVSAVPGPHAYLVGGAHAWRNDLTRAQASLAFRMQYAPHAFAERMALFWHNLFATGNHKVDNPSLMLEQYATLRAHGLDRFDDLLVRVSKDPAMCLWLDSVRNNASGSNVPNENYAREVMELYSLGADNGYSQDDITQLARALSGWSFTVASADMVVNPTNPQSRTIARGNFRVYDGSANPDPYLWEESTRATLPRLHGTGTITFLGQTFDIATAPAGMAPGENAIRSILTSRPAQCSEFLAQRLLTHFVTARFTGQDVADVAAAIRAAGFDLRAVMKVLLGSRFFFAAENRHALVEGPVSWVVRAARALGLDLAAADAQAPKGFPAWALVVNPQLDWAGMKLLDPSGPNGWKEDVVWLNSNTIRYRTRFAAAIALDEKYTSNQTAYTLFPADVATWFPQAPADPAAVWTRIAALLQPGPVPATVRDGWLAALWPAGAPFTWDAAGQDRARELAYLVLCSPAGQLY
jgi:uncharacterized protein (DUF1800 family)